MQFFGTFLGATCGGFLYQHFGARGVFMLDTVLLVAWLAAASGMKVPRPVRARSYAIPALDNVRLQELRALLEAQPGVREVHLGTGERTAVLKVDSVGFDEQHVIRLIAGET